MLKALQELLFNKNIKEAEPQLDIKLAAATLMYELIRSDGNIDNQELAHMSLLLKAQFSLDDDKLKELFELAEKNAEEATSLYAFTSEICQQWDNGKRFELLKNLWLLALSDNEIDRHERHFVRKIAGLLYLNEAEIIQSRAAAKQELGLNQA